MNISLEQLKNLIMKYDWCYGEYPESSYEGLNVYQFICKELNTESDINNGRFDIEYFNLLQNTFHENK